MLLVLPLIARALLAGAPTVGPDTTAYAPRDAARDLAALVVVDSSRFGYSIELDTARATGALGALARANRHYVLYLTLNAPSEPLGRSALLGDWATVRRTVLGRLTSDTAYLRVLAQSVGRYRAAVMRGRAAADDAAGDRTAGLRAVGFRRVVDVAARFFYPDEVLPDGQIQAHICVGINGVVDMQGGRDLAVEAFAYAAIFHDLLAPQGGLDAEFQATKRLVNAMDLSSDPAARLHRAQGVMWAAMLRSERLRHVLRAEYARAQSYLPFRLASEPSHGAAAARR